MPIAQPGPDAPASRLLRARGRVRQGINVALQRAGLTLVPTPPAERLEDEFLELYGRSRMATMTSRERMYALYQAVDHVTRAGVRGDIVECGVWRGGSTMLAAMTLAGRGDDDRRLWLYDTFEGMAQPGPMDTSGAYGEDPHEEWRALQAEGHNEWCYSPLDEVQRNMAATGLPSDRFVYVQGLVEETLPGTMPTEIAILRLDTDWYESTRHELVHLFPHLVSGGLLIVDDYGHWEGARRAVDEYLAETGTQILLHRIDQSGRIGRKE